MHSLLWGSIHYTGDSHYLLLETLTRVALTNLGNTFKSGVVCTHHPEGNSLIRGAFTKSGNTHSLLWANTHYSAGHALVWGDTHYFDGHSQLGGSLISVTHTALGYTHYSRGALTALRTLTTRWEAPVGALTSSNYLEITTCDIIIISMIISK